jgi:hypothetical protein
MRTKGSPRSLSLLGLILISINCADASSFLEIPNEALKLLNPPLTTCDESNRPFIINGIPTNDFKPVRKVRISDNLAGESGDCTTTLISSGYFLLSAHCFCSLSESEVIDPDSRIYQIWIDDEVWSTTVKIHPKCRPCKKGYSIEGCDLAKIPLEKETFLRLQRKYGSYSIATRSPTEGDAVTLVGFGRNDSSTTGGSKHVGYNKIEKISLSENYIQTRGMTKAPEAFDWGAFEWKISPNGEMAATSKGDSGGPLLIGNTVVGVASSGNSKTFNANFSIKSGFFLTSPNYYTFLHSKENLDFLNRN